MNSTVHQLESIGSKSIQVGEVLLRRATPKAKHALNLFEKLLDKLLIDESKDLKGTRR